MQATIRLRRRCQLAAAAFAALSPFAGLGQTSGFTGAFAPENWAFISGGAPAAFSWNADFTSFTLSGSDSGTGTSSTTLFTVNLAEAYRVSFSWSYVTADEAQYDYVGYTSGSFVQLSSSVFGQSQNGSLASPVDFRVGDAGFFVTSSDNRFGAASLIISNFRFALASPPDSGGGGGGSPPPGTPYAGSVAWSATVGDWSRTDIWGQLPDSSLRAVITAAASVAITTAAEAHSVYLDDSRLTVSGSGSFTQSNAQSAFVADYGATFTVTGSDAAWSSAGTLDFYTADAVFDQDSTSGVARINLAIFDDNVATLTVRNGARLTADAVFVGLSGRGEVQLESGATVTLGDTLVGCGPGSVGRLSVTGVGTSLSSAFLKIGEFSGGTLSISGGAVVNSASAAVAFGSANGAGDVAGVATVTGAGSRWNVASDLGVATYIDNTMFSDGTLTIAEGGFVRVGATGAGAVNIDRRGTLSIGTGGISGILQAGTVSFIATSGAAALVAFNHTDDLTFSPLITGRGRVSKAGAGTLALTADNDYSQNTTVTGGTLQLGAGGSTGSLTGDVAVSSGASLAFNRSNNLTFSGVISGEGSVIKNGSGNLTLSGSNTHTGGTRVNSGTLSVSTDAALGGAAGGVILAGGNLRLSNNSATTFNRAVTVSADSGVISNRSGNGAGVTHVLETLSIGARTLSITRGPNVTSGVGGLTFGATILTGDANFQVGANARLNLGAISGTFGFNKSGLGNLTLTGSNSFSGPLTISAGTLAFAAAAALPAAADVRIGTGAAFNVSAVAGGYTVRTGGTLGGSGSVSGLVTVADGGSLLSGGTPGTLTFNTGLALQAGSTVNFKLGLQSDSIRVTGGALSGPASGAVIINLADSGGFGAGSYVLFDASGAALSSIGATSFHLGQTIAGFAFAISRDNDRFLLSATAIPEPSVAAALVGLATLGFCATRRRRR